MATVLYLACALVAVLYQQRFVTALSLHDPAIPDLRAVSDAMLDRPGRVFQTSMSVAWTYIKALFRRQEDDDLEGLRRTALAWWAVALALFAWVVVS